MAADARKISQFRRGVMGLDCHGMSPLSVYGMAESTRFYRDLLH